MLTLNEKIAQMMICGIDGTEVDESARALVETLKVGGIILYGKNTPTAETTFNLTYDLSALAKSASLPLIIAIDEEHGRVTRIKEGVTHFVDMRTIGRLNDPGIVKEIAKITSLELIACGINMNLAPVCDVNVNSGNDVIGDRSFSSDPGIVAKMTEAYIEEGARAGMILCAKHFPGHGDTSTDSHFALPVVNKNLNKLKKCEFIPFQTAIRKDVPTIMTAHILFPKIDNLPATMSAKIITDILIKDLWYTGVIVSDDMSMGAITGNFGALDAFTQSINAGVNMFIVSNMPKNRIDVSKLIEGLAREVKKGIIEEKLIDSSVEKILELKKKFIRNTRRKRVLRRGSLRQKTSLTFSNFLAAEKRRLIGQADK